MSECIKPYTPDSELGYFLGRPFVYERGGVTHYEIAYKIWVTGNTGMINDYTFENLAKYGKWVDTMEPMGDEEDD